MKKLVVAVGVAALFLLSGATAASAAAPVKDGWWSETNVGLGLSAEPAQVPSGGLYVENGFGGPVAYSALTFTVPAGQEVGKLTLRVAGNPMITSAPFACPLTAAGSNYKPAQGGPWSDRPSYDCNQSKVTADVASDHSTVSFDAGPLLHDGSVAIAVLAGGPGDQIAFDPPGPDTLAVTPSGNGTATTPPAAPAPSPAPVASGAPAPAPATSPAAPSAQTASPAVPSAAAALPAPAQTSPPLAAPSGPASSGSSVAASSPPASPPRSAGHSGGTRVGEMLALIGLVGLLVAYTEGYGLLGGRIGPRFHPGQRRSRPA